MRVVELRDLPDLDDVVACAEWVKERSQEALLEMLEDRPSKVKPMCTNPKELIGLELGIAKLELRAGDILAIEVPDNMADAVPELARQLNEMIARVVGAYIGVLWLASGTKLSIVRQAEPSERQPPERIIPADIVG